MSWHTIDGRGVVIDHYDVSGRGCVHSVRLSYGAAACGPVNILGRPPRRALVTSIEWRSDPRRHVGVVMRGENHLPEGTWLEWEAR